LSGTEKGEGVGCDSSQQGRGVTSPGPLCWSLWRGAEGAAPPLGIRWVHCQEKRLTYGQAVSLL